MPLVVLEGPGLPTREVRVEGGARLLDVCDEESLGVPFSCRSASCGTCRIDVLEGGALLEPPADEELEVLDIFGDDPAERRLACQVRLRAGEGEGEGEGERRLRVRPSE
jgi:2Fe-2S ferredoxin